MPSTTAPCCIQVLLPSLCGSVGLFLLGMSSASDGVESTIELWVGVWSVCVAVAWGLLAMSGGPGAESGGDSLREALRDAADSSESSLSNAEADTTTRSTSRMGC